MGVYGNLPVTGLKWMDRAGGMGNRIAAVASTRVCRCVHRFVLGTADLSDADILVGMCGARVSMRQATQPRRLDFTVTTLTAAQPCPACAPRGKLNVTYHSIPAIRKSMPRP